MSKMDRLTYDRLMQRYLESAEGHDGSSRFVVNTSPLR